MATPYKPMTKWEKEKAIRKLKAFPINLAVVLIVLAITYYIATLLANTK